ncbi:unnamed protein product [Amoebophrya sp. A120]|nr:unnamed protein product [Amoebophrya sp. A120]|eukprot:GSA120T00017634001.1
MMVQSGNVTARQLAASQSASLGQLGGGSSAGAAAGGKNNNHFPTVLYFSKTHNKSMQAKLENTNYDDQGNVVSYDLDIKPKAKPDLVTFHLPPSTTSAASSVKTRVVASASSGGIRNSGSTVTAAPHESPATVNGQSSQPLSPESVGGPAPSEASSSNPTTAKHSSPSPTSARGAPLITSTLAAAAGVKVGTTVVSSSSTAPFGGTIISSSISQPVIQTANTTNSTNLVAANGVVGAAAAPRNKQVDFQVGHKVWYWSNTHKQWMEAKVKGIGKRAGRIELDVKPDAHLKYVMAQDGTGQKPTLSPDQMNSAGGGLVGTTNTISASSPMGSSLASTVTTRTLTSPVHPDINVGPSPTTNLEPKRMYGSRHSPIDPNAGEPKVLQGGSTPTDSSTSTVHQHPRRPPPTTVVSSTTTRHQRSSVQISTQIAAPPLQTYGASAASSRRPSSVSWEVRSADPRVRAVYEAGAANGTGLIGSVTSTTAAGVVVPAKSSSGGTPTTATAIPSNATAVHPYNPEARVVPQQQASGSTSGSSAAAKVMQNKTTTTTTTTTTVPATTSGGAATDKETREQTASSRRRGSTMRIVESSTTETTTVRSGAGVAASSAHQGTGTTSRPAAAAAPASSTGAAQTVVQSYSLVQHHPTAGTIQRVGGTGTGSQAVAQQQPPKESSSSVSADARGVGFSASSTSSSSSCEGAAQHQPSTATLDPGSIPVRKSSAAAIVLNSSIGMSGSGLGLLSSSASSSAAGEGGTTAATTYTTIAGTTVAASSSTAANGNILQAQPLASPPAIRIAGVTTTALPNRSSSPAKLVTAANASPVSAVVNSTSGGQPGNKTTTTTITTRRFTSESLGRQAADAYYGPGGPGYQPPVSLTSYRLDKEFNPSSQSLMSTAKRWLELPDQAHISRLPGFQGGLNKGIYLAEGKGIESKIIKVVAAGSQHPGLLSEAENCMRLKNEVSGLKNDQAITCPGLIIRVEHRSPETNEPELLDVILMRKARGTRLSEIFADMMTRKELLRVVDMLRQFGKFLKAFHTRYPGKQHGDVQPSNVFCDPSAGHFTLIDMGGMGQKTVKNDLEHFSESLKLMGDSYGADFRIKGDSAFKEGYRMQMTKEFKAYPIQGS